MTGVLIGIVVVCLLFFAGIIILAIGVYNSLIFLKESIEKSWANIDVILKQRYDEIPQLIQICEQYVTYEKGMIEKIMSARERMVQGRSLVEKAEGFNELSQGISGLLAVGESYPELKADSNFMQIQSRLSELEERLADRRELYNESVNSYNIRIQQIPDVFVARFLNYEAKEMFKVLEEEKAVPNLKMNL